LILVAGHLDPSDTNDGTSVLDVFAARVFHVLDVPLDEEGETLRQGRVEGYQVPCELDAVGTRSAHAERLAASSSDRGVDVVGAQAQCRGCLADLGELPLHPRAKRA
jgi:hypothetical protein